MYPVPVKPLTTEEVSALIEEQALTREDLMDSLRQIMEIRALESNISKLLTKAVLKGASHLYAGQEAVAVGAVSALRDDDLITSTHRGHGHAHAHGDKAAKTPEAKQEHYNKMMAEVLGKSGGYCKGKGGSMHIADASTTATWAPPALLAAISPWRLAPRWLRSCKHRSRRALFLRRWRQQRRQLPREPQHGQRLELARDLHR